MTTITKTIIAKASDDEPLEYIMSDGSVDRVGDIIDPAGWQTRDFMRNPIALFNHDSDFIVGHWKDVRVENGALRGRLEVMRKGISHRLDEVIAAVEAGILRAVSVGFRALDSKPLENGGRRFTKSELIECSLVSIPANPNALQIAKALNLSADAQAVIFGKSAAPDHVVNKHRQSSGKPAVSQSSHHGHQKMNPISQRIEDAQKKLVELRDKLTEHLNDNDAENDETFNDVTEGLNDQISVTERTVESLKQAELRLAFKSEPAVPATKAPNGDSRRPFAMPKKEHKASDLIIRAAAVHAIAHASGKDYDAVLSSRYGDDEQIGAVVKAAVSGATTTTTGWAAELVNTAMTEFLETLRPRSVYPALSDAGGGRLAFGPNQGAIKIPSRATTPSIGGSFVGEGAPIPVRRLGLAAITLTPKKMGVISVFSREIARYSTPAIETLIRQEIEADTALTLDSLLLDAVAGSSVRPAGLLNGVAFLTPTAGGGYAAILGDIRKLRAPFDAANASRSLIMLVNPAQEEAFSMTPGADGSLTWSSGILTRYRVVSSTAIPVGRVIMLDAADFVTATGDVPEFEVSNEATLHMEDTTPLQIGTAGTPTVVAAPTQSMYQTAQIAVRMLLDVSWAMRRTGMVQYIDAVTW